MNSVVTKILDCCYHYSNNNNNNNKMLFKPQSLSSLLSSDSDDMDDNESTTNKLSSKSSYQHRNRCPQSLISSESLSLSSFTTNLPHLSSSNDDDIDRISQSSAYQSLSSSYRSAIDSNFSIKINNNVAHHDRTTITEHYSLSSIMLPYHYHYHHRHLLKNFHQRCLLILFLISILFDYSKFVHCDRNRFYHISALCLRERVHPLSKKIDGAVITSKAENNLDCTITFQTDTILQKFMLRFEKLALDCNDHLYIYDGAHTIGNHKADLSCRSTRTEVGTIYTQSNFLTLRYQTDAYSKADNGFRLIITAYKDSKNYCREHRCANQYCISRDLVCDGVNHCGDNSDEHYYVHCQENEINDTIIGLDPMLFIAIVSTIFILCLTLVIMVTFCLCRRERLLIQQRQQQQQMALQQQQQYQLHDTGHHLGTTPLMMHQQYHQQHQHYPNNNNSTYQTKLDGACTMITSLDYGTTTTTQTALAAFGASNAITGGMITRNGGLVNSYTHTALPNNNVNQNHFATLPHQHHNHQQQQVMLPGQQQGSPILQQQHVRFGTLPNRSGSISNNNNLNNSPQHNGNLAGLMNTVVTTNNTGNGHVTTIPVSSANNNNNLQQLS